MNTRTEFSKKTKLQRFQIANGMCEECGTKLRPGKIEYDHYLPCVFGGDGSLDNCRVLCSACHRHKTGKKDVPEIAKSNRIRAKHVGARVSRRPMPGSRRSLYKKKFDGTVVRR